MPSPCRKSASTTDIRTKQVVIKSTAGARLTTPNTSAAESVASRDLPPANRETRLESTAEASPPTSGTASPAGRGGACSTAVTRAGAGAAGISSPYPEAAQSKVASRQKVGLLSATFPLQKACRSIMPPPAQGPVQKFHWARQERLLKRSSANC